LRRAGRRNPRLRRLSGLGWRFVSADQPEGADFLADAVFIDLHIARLEVPDQTALLIADDQVERDLIYGGADRKLVLGLRRILSRRRNDAAEGAHQTAVKLSFSIARDWLETQTSL
jgi:hypothetical protein